MRYYAALHWQQIVPTACVPFKAHILLTINNVPDFKVILNIVLFTNLEENENALTSLD